MKVIKIFVLGMLTCAFCFPSISFAKKSQQPRNVRLVKVDKSRKKVEIAWRGPASAEPVKSYQIFRNAVKVGETKNNRFVDKKAKAGSSNYKVMAVYESGVMVPAQKIINVKMPTDRPSF